MDDAHHRHVPYAVILLQALQAWRESHGGKSPATSPEKAEFRRALMEGQR